jgi:hypothetical protein
MTTAIGRGFLSFNEKKPEAMPDFQITYSPPRLGASTKN